MAALQKIKIPDISQAGENLFEHLQNSSKPVHELFFESLIAEIVAIPERFVLVLDDFHAVTESKILEELFFYLKACLRVCRVCI